MFTDAHSTVTAVDGDRYPIRPPEPALGPLMLAVISVRAIELPFVIGAG